MGDDKPAVYGTAGLGDAVSRADFERALRALNVTHLELREMVLKLAAQLITLTDEVTRRIDGVEPHPAPPNTPAVAVTHTVEQMVATLTPQTVDLLVAHDAVGPQRTVLDQGESKYAAEAVAIPCEELIPLCGARCCTLTFALSTEDLDEGVVRWDYGQPYLIRQRASDAYCVHNSPETRGCTVHAYRPRVCRVYDCRDDKRIWENYEQRIPAPPKPNGPRDVPPKLEIKGDDLIDLVQRHRAKRLEEARAISRSYSDYDAAVGPEPDPAKPKR